MVSTMVLAVAAAMACPVTEPNGVGVTGSTEPCAAGCAHGNERLSTGPFGLWPNGKIVFQPGGPGFVTRAADVGPLCDWSTDRAGIPCDGVDLSDAGLLGGHRSRR